jgi:hypothetical protein
MSASKQVKPGNENLTRSFKLAVCAAVLGCVVLAVETPNLVRAPDEHATPAHSVAPLAGAPASDYFPAQFPAPKGEAEPAPPTF